MLACLVLALPGAVGHAILTYPVSRAIWDTVKDGILELNDKSLVTYNGYQYAGTCTNNFCNWYTQDTTTQTVDNCDPQYRTLGVDCRSKNPIDWPCSPADAAVPWCAPGFAPVVSPCGRFGGTVGRDMLDLDAAPAPTWELGSNQTVAWSILANHGGGYQYRLCKADKALTEECFQRTVLGYATNDQYLRDPEGKLAVLNTAVRMATPTGVWTRNPFAQELDLPGIPDFDASKGRGPFAFNLVDTVKVPSDLPIGHYVLSFRWDAEQTRQVWSQCGDVMVVAKGTAPPFRVATQVTSTVVVTRNGKTMSSSSKSTDTLSDATLIAPPEDAPPVVYCRGGSIGLHVDDCTAWIDLFDALGGPQWPAEWSNGCRDLRTDPCGCKGGWDMHIVCSAERGLAAITELYLLSRQLVGDLPLSFLKFSRLNSLSLVGTGITGALPSGMGQAMPNLKRIWLDHNPSLRGPVPQDWLELKLEVLELHYSGFTGLLPAFQFLQIPDCTLNGVAFACPLPKGAEVCGAVCGAAPVSKKRRQP